MRLKLALLLLAASSSAIGQGLPKGGDRTYPAQWVPLLRALSKQQVATMQAAANQYCLALDYVAHRELYPDVSACTLSQATAIMSVDVALTALESDPPTKYRPRQVEKCWRVYRALGARDVENLAHCFGDIQHFELLQRVADSSEPAPAPAASSYCDKVAEAAGGSYMILEECIKQENASRRRLGR